MSGDLFAWGPNQLAIGLLSVYVLAGFAVGAALGRRGIAPAAAVSAIAIWPLMLPLLSGPTGPALRAGPLGARIDEVFGALSAVLAETGTTELSGPDLDRLRSSLHRADERLALVDALLARPLDAGAGVARLAEARAHAGSEIEAVLQGLLELRLQVGLLTLSGRGGSVTEQLRTLQSRVAALEEVASVS